MENLKTLSKKVWKKPGNLKWRMSGNPVKLVNPLYTGGLFHCYILDEPVCYVRGVRSILVLSFYF